MIEMQGSINLTSYSNISDVNLAYYYLLGEWIFGFSVCGLKPSSGNLISHNLRVE